MPVQKAKQRSSRRRPRTSSTRSTLQNRNRNRNHYHSHAHLYTRRRRGGTWVRKTRSCGGVNDYIAIESLLTRSSICEPILKKGYIFRAPDKTFENWFKLYLTQNNNTDVKFNYNYTNQKQTEGTIYYTDPNNDRMAVEFFKPKPKRWLEPTCTPKDGRILTIYVVKEAYKLNTRTLHRNNN